MAIIEVAAAKVGELQEGQMKEVAVGEGKALLVFTNGQYKAVGALCPHYGAPLIKGTFASNCVRCPWHGSKYNVDTGDIEDFPTNYPIHKFDVRVDGETVFISGEEESFKAKHRGGPSPCASENDSRVFLIVGLGPAALSAIETLRASGYQGRIVVASKEGSVAYDRPKLSKAMHLSADAIALRPLDFYSQHAVDLRLNTEVVTFDAAAKTAVLSNGDVITFNKALLATGASPRTLPVPGAQLRNIHVLRTPTEANDVIKAAEGKHVVVIGSSFIGMEAAACLSAKAASVHVVGLEAVPFERVLGPKVGAAMQKLHEAKGKVVFHMNRKTDCFVGEETVRAVKLDNGEELPADLVLLGVGVAPATAYVKRDAGITVERDGSIVADQTLQCASDVFVAGDIARFPLPLAGGAVRIEHYQVAQYTGALAARNMLGKGEAAHTVPFFWTVHYGMSLRYAGYAATYDDVIIEGSLEEHKFAAYYVSGDKVLAVATLMFDPRAAQAADLLAVGKMPTATEIRNGTANWSRLV
eukprot:Colp12_sorted_trinity150504_noHs@6846